MMMFVRCKKSVNLKKRYGCFIKDQVYEIVPSREHMAVGEYMIIDVCGNVLPINFKSKFFGKHFEFI